MDSNKKVSEPSWRWTNERHFHFLNSMEDSFVRTMLQNNTKICLPPLDRYLPDTCDSTVDLQKERRRRHSASDILDQRAKKDKKTRKLLSLSYVSREDQVVPQVENGRVDHAAN
ncbi:hypothetical protein LguiA_024047 [Lonicera macranthoides]